MKEENGRSEPRQRLDTFGNKANRGPLGFLAQAGLLFGIVVVGVLSTSPFGRTVAIYAAGGFGLVGIIFGARYGFLFNISNRCMGGGILWGFIGSVGGAALGVLVVALVVAIAGTAVGFIVGWGILLTKKNWTLAPLFGVGAGAVAQAVWTEPTTVLQAAAIGGACGAVVGPMFFFICVALGYFVLRGTGARRSF